MNIKDNNSYSSAGAPHVNWSPAGGDLSKPYHSKKCKFWRVQGEPTKCFFCKAPTLHILIYRDGSEDWACKKCLWIHGKIRRFRSDHHKTRVDGKQAILSQVSCVDLHKNAMLGVRQ